MKRNNRILLVEDEELIRNGIKEKLESESYAVTAVQDGGEALSECGKKSFDLIILDLVLPDINGLELLNRLKAIQSHEVGVIVITGHADMFTYIEAFRSGVDDYLLKPFNNKELLARIHNCLEKKRHEKILRMHEEVLAVSTDLVSLISPEHKILFSNNSFARIIPRGSEGVDGVRLSEIFEEELYDATMKKALDDCFKGIKSRHHSPFCLDEGSPGFFHFSYSPVISKNGSVTAVVLSMRDLTEYHLVLQQLKESEERLHLALDIASDGVWDRNLVTGETLYGENWAKLVGYTLEELKRKNINFNDLLHPEDRGKTLKLIKDHFRGETERYVAEFRLQTKVGGWRWILARGQVVARGEHGEPLRFLGTHTDITRQKEAELRLLASEERLMETVDSRTKQVASKNKNLEQVNVALTVLLKKREQDKKELEEQVLSNFKVLISPYMEKMKNSELTDSQQAYLNILETNLNNIVSPFSHHLSSHNLDYTPTEIQVANLIKDGKSSKEIAEIMNLSPETISNHRKHIRKKSGISNKKVNLRTALMSLDNPQE